MSQTETPPVRPEYAVCPDCGKSVRVEVEPNQKHRIIRFHGPELGKLCPGSGKQI